MKRLLLIPTVVLALAGCSSTHQDAPDPTPDNIVNGTKSHVIQEPDGFRNVAFSCYGKNGVYVTSRGTAATQYVGSGIFVVPNDPNCI